MKQVIGQETAYTGSEHPHLVGYRIKVIAVFKGAAAPDFDPDRPGMLITDDATLAQNGGLTTDDRVEVLPWIAKERDWSFCSSDVRVGDLEGLEGGARAALLAHAKGLMASRISTAEAQGRWVTLTDLKLSAEEIAASERDGFAVPDVAAARYDLYSAVRG